MSKEEQVIAIFQALCEDNKTRYSTSLSPDSLRKKAKEFADSLSTPKDSK